VEKNARGTTRIGLLLTKSWTLFGCYLGVVDVTRCGERVGIAIMINVYTVTHNIVFSHPMLYVTRSNPPKQHRKGRASHGPVKGGL
jgi:hypothetical protein